MPQITVWEILGKSKGLHNCQVSITWLHSRRMGMLWYWEEKNKYILLTKNDIWQVPSAYSVIKVLCPENLNPKELYNSLLISGQKYQDIMDAYMKKDAKNFDDISKIIHEKMNKYLDQKDTSFSLLLLEMNKIRYDQFLKDEKDATEDAKATKDAKATEDVQATE